MCAEARAAGRGSGEWGERAALALALIAPLASLCLSGCNMAAPEAEQPREEPREEAPPAQARPVLGVMSALPLNWPIGASLEQIAQGVYAAPWLGARLGLHYEMVALDTLTPIPAMNPARAPHDPLAGIERLAVIQPRGLSPADNVALDKWVRAGGALLLALDPALTGHYDVPLTDPRHPPVTALIPPVVARWGLAVRFDEAQGEALAFADVPGAKLPLHLAGEITPLEGSIGLGNNGSGKGECQIDASRALATCAVGKGRVTVLADAAVFEHEELAGGEVEGVSGGGGDESGGGALAALLRHAFDPDGR